MPRAAENRYPEVDNTRVVMAGPVLDADLDYARDVLIDTISDNLEAVADAKGVQFLKLTSIPGARGLRDRFEPVADLPDADDERMGRWTADVGVQGDLEESLHLNRYGQRAFGDCLGLVATDDPSRDYACSNTPGLVPINGVGPHLLTRQNGSLFGREDHAHAARVRNPGGESPPSARHLRGPADAREAIRPASAAGQAISRRSRT